MPCVPGAAGLTEYTAKARSHTVQNTGPEAYHLLLVENLCESGWTSQETLQTPGLRLRLRVIRENRPFRVYDTDLAGVREHAHQVPTVVVLVSGEAMAGDQRLDQPCRWALVPAGENHRITSLGNARIVKIEVR